jgi:predicted nucleotidyltransferase component of viral defense system
MIGQEEIESMAESMGVHHANVERDYVFGWLLKCFYENSYLAPLLVFKGGNCMRKAYYPDTRFSNDLDFSLGTEVDVERMQSEINKACSVAHTLCGVEFIIDRNTLKPDRAIDKERQSFKGSVYFRDFYGNADNVTISVRLDMTEFDRLFLPIVQRPLLHAYSDSEQCQATLRCMALEELLANKLKCLIQRRHSFDLYDLVYSTFFDKTIEVNRATVLSVFLRKTIFGSRPAAARDILLGLPMPFFRGAWDRYVAPLTARITFDQAEEAFRSIINAIFAVVSPARTGAATNEFFPADLRNMIMEAAAGRLLLQLSYDGWERVVEPYALTYKRRQDGQAAEYFYVWDRSGGSSGPGIKSWFHHKIQNMRLTDKTFDPQYPIELGKSGEQVSKGYFGKPFSERQERASFGRSAITKRPMSSRPKASSSGHYGVSYTIECPYCHKRFKRDKMTTTLNPHKDANGWQCSGRTGYFV